MVFVIFHKYGARIPSRLYTYLQFGSQEPVGSWLLSFQLRPREVVAALGLFRLVFFF